MSYVMRRGSPHAGDTGWWDPFSELEAIHRRLEQLFSGTDATWSADVGMDETDDGWIVEAPLPGVPPRDVDVDLHDRELTIRATSRPRTTGTDRVRARRHYDYRLTLPGDVDPDRVEADLEYGVLTVSLPRAVPVTNRKIRIGTAGARPTGAREITASLPAELTASPEPVPDASPGPMRAASPEPRPSRERQLTRSPEPGLAASPDLGPERELTRRPGPASRPEPVTGPGSVSRPEPASTPERTPRPRPESRPAPEPAAYQTIDEWDDELDLANAEYDTERLSTLYRPETPHHDADRDEAGPASRDEPRPASRDEPAPAPWSDEVAPASRGLPDDHSPVTEGSSRYHLFDDPEDPLDRVTRPEWRDTPGRFLLAEPVDPRDLDPRDLDPRDMPVDGYDRGRARRRHRRSYPADGTGEHLPAGPIPDHDNAPPPRRWDRSNPARSGHWADDEDPELFDRDPDDQDPDDPYHEWPDLEGEPSHHEQPT